MRGFLKSPAISSRRTLRLTTKKETYSGERFAMAKLYFNYGAMNAGKSTILLQAAYNYEERGMRTLLLKPEIDKRCLDNEAIASRIGIQGQADVFCKDTDLEAYIIKKSKDEPLNCVLLDEAQFLSRDQVWQ